MSNKEIARELTVSMHTVKDYVSAIMCAVNTSSRAKAVQAIWLGLLVRER